jgi:galactose mutarotase-like enzyme
METFEYQDRKICRWQIGASTFLADPSAGCRLMSWFLQLADGSTRDVFYWPENPEDLDFGKIHGGNPILFPFAGRCSIEGENGLWLDFNKEKRVMPQHGFARNCEFELVDSQPNRFSAKLIPNEIALEAYPYDYDFTVTYIFEELGFKVELSLNNHEAFPISWAPGHHFYFNIPWHSGLQRSDYTIHIPAKRALRHLPDGKLEPEILDKKKQLYSLGDPKLLNRIHLYLQTNECQVNPAGGEEPIYIRFLENNPLNNARTIVTWAPNEDSPFYCVEPWMSPPNSPAHRNGLQYVNPGENSTFTVEVSLT